MDTISRRKFLKLTAGAAVGAFATQLSLADIVQAGISRPLPLGTPILVVVTLYGGNDGLNTVVPYQDPIYQSLRPDIFLPEKSVIPLGEGLGLNGSMVGFKTLWDRNELAIIRGVGYPNPDRSHFSSMAIWQSGAPGAHISTGWIGRWLDNQKHDPMTAIGLGSVLPPLLAGAKQVGSVLPLGGLSVPTGQMAQHFQYLARPSGDDLPMQAMAANNLADLFSLNKDVAPILKRPAIKPDDLPTAIGSNFGGDQSLSQQLDLVSKLIAADAPTRVWAVSLGGFDTHADEVKSQSALLGTVSTAITKFISQIHTTHRKNDVTVLVYSEFGRRVKANASHGTDHGTSGPVFVIGGNVAGGKFYGDEPSLSKLVNGDLAVTTDFRDVYGAMLEGVLGSDESQVLNNWKSKLPLFKSN
jgi:uncharacterized protein (DUF1501 family)